MMRGVGRGGGGGNRDWMGAGNRDWMGINGDAQSQSPGSDIGDGFTQRVKKPVNALMITPWISPAQWPFHLPFWCGWTRQLTSKTPSQNTVDKITQPMVAPLLISKTSMVHDMIGTMHVWLSLEILTWRLMDFSTCKLYRYEGFALGPLCKLCSNDNLYQAWQINTAFDLIRNRSFCIKLRCF